ncbi:MAG: ATP-binding protein [bacterium]|nr:ATP-binding protein [bacterium]
MRRIRSKLVLALLVVTLIPLVPSYYLVRSLVDRSFELGFNQTVERAIEGAASMSRQLYARHRQESLELGRAVALSPAVLSLVQGDVGAETQERARMAAAPLGQYVLHAYDPSGTRVSVFEELPDPLQAATETAEEAEADAGSRYEAEFSEDPEEISFGEQLAEEAFNLVWAPPEGAPIEDYVGQIEALLADGRAVLLDSNNDPGYVTMFLPVYAGKSTAGALLISRRTPEGFPQTARHVMVVNQFFKTIDYYKDDLRGLFIGVFVVFYLILAALAAAVGYVFSRRITAPLLRLVAGTHEVARGDLEYQIQVSSRDEIGQLMASFNHMIAAIKENQQLAQERERARQQVASESAQYERDLEVAQLQTRALQAENERKNIELKKGEELERAYGELEESHRRLQEVQMQLILQEKMASLGTMVAGFAHEINNPMGAVRGATDVAMRCVRRLQQSMAVAGAPGAEDEKTIRILQDNLRVIGDAEDRVARLVESLRNFGRLDEAAFQVADLHEGLDSTVHLLGQMLGSRITVHRQYGEIPRTFCSAAQLNQVFISVLRNAIQAIEADGEIAIHTSVDAGRIVVRIRDTGKGMPPAQLDRVFDLHFSSDTSRVKLGSGLSMAYRIVQEHGGDLRINSAPGTGTEVAILLPIRDGAARGATPS